MSNTWTAGCWYGSQSLGIVTRRRQRSHIAVALTEIVGQRNTQRLLLYVRVDGRFQFSPAPTHTHTRLMALCPGVPGRAGTRKVKPIWILLKQETVSGSGISWDVCKSAPRSRQITMPATLPTNQQHQSTEGILHQQFTTTITDIHFCITQFQFYDSALSLHLLDKWPASPELTKQSSKKM